MQSDQITLNVDEDANTGTAPVVTVYSRYDTYQNRSEYIAAEHQLALRSKLGLYRTLPKSTGNFRGTAKAALKLTRDFQVPGVDATTLVTVPAIIDIGFSIPIGMTAAEVLAFRMRAAALIQHNTVMDALLLQQMI